MIKSSNRLLILLKPSYELMFTYLIVRIYLLINYVYEIIIYI